MPHSQPQNWIVQKYGGTSVGKFLPQITESIVPSYRQLHRVAVVCSARSGATKSSGTTSLLLKAIRLATSKTPRSDSLRDIIGGIREEHFNAAEEALGEDAIQTLEDVRLQIIRDCGKLHDLLEATVMLGEISDRTADRVVAVGETLACRIVAASLKSKGVPSKVITLEAIVEEAYGGDHDQLLKRFRRHPGEFLHGLTDVLRTRIEVRGNVVPVISGFFGAIPGSLFKSVSRGYSDLCAALCAVALGAEELQIWKEVDGIFTADPRKVPGARLLATITSEEAAELTYYGSEVLHPLTIEQIDGAGISLRLKNVMDPQGMGTIIHPSSRAFLPFSAVKTPPMMPKNEHDVEAASAKLSFMAANGYYGPNQYRRKPTAVTVKENISILNIRSHSTTSPQVFLSRVSQCLEANDIIIDLISSSQQMLSLALHAPEARSLDHVTQTLQELGAVSLMNEMSIVSVIGHRMRNVVGIGAEIFSALASARVNVYLISQGASEINISFVVNVRDAQAAMEVVHEEVLGIPRHEEKENALVKGPWLY